MAHLALVLSIGLALAPALGWAKTPCPPVQSSAQIAATIAGCQAYGKKAATIATHRDAGMPIEEAGTTFADRYLVILIYILSDCSPECQRNSIENDCLQRALVALASDT